LCLHVPCLLLACTARNAMSGEPAGREGKFGAGYNDQAVAKKCPSFASRM